ncbi:MAG: methyltransferase domain-containing protein [Armatimonadetes bacterium]|nr:methyltransferase domain-containing protein [Anaerolineae bacterium]
MYSDYDTLAWLYNQHWGDFSQRILPVVEKLLLTQIPNGSLLLDICCGTGQLAQLLTAKGYAVTGIDGSAEMLHYARQNAPEATFVQADAQDFTVGTGYAGAICAYDSLNHVPDVAALRAVFGCIYQALLPGARLIFDINTDLSYRANWRGSFGEAYADHVFLVRSMYDPSTADARMDFTIFRLIETLWQRSDLTLTQHCYTEAEWRTALSTVGFAETEVYDAYAAFGMQGGSGRAIYSARKPLT